MLCYLIATWICLCSVSIICIRPKQEETEEQTCNDLDLEADKSIDQNSSLISMNLDTNQDQELSLKEIISDKRFWYLYAMNFCSVFYGYVLITSYKVFGSQFIHDDMFLTMVGSIACVCGSLRFFWSMLLDFKYSYA
jgi:hypothetical protein